MIAQAHPRRAESSQLVDALDLILLWIDRTKQRAQLAELERSSLGDLGLSRADVDRESRKRFWES